jgi:hypothetical protein
VKNYLFNNSIISFVEIIFIFSCFLSSKSSDHIGHELKAREVAKKIISSWSILPIIFSASSLYSII